MKPERIEEIEAYAGRRPTTQLESQLQLFNEELIDSLLAALRSNSELKRRMETIRFVVVDAELKLKGISDLADIHEFEGE